MATSGTDLRQRRRATTEKEEEVPLKDGKEKEKSGEEFGQKLEVKSSGIGWGGAFCFLMVARYYSAVYNNIHDCDEVFNYWEPLHYLLYKSGFQTWEYRYGVIVQERVFVLKLIVFLTCKFFNKHFFCVVQVCC